VTSREKRYKSGVSYGSERFQRRLGSFDKRDVNGSQMLGKYGMIRAGWAPEQYRGERDVSGGNEKGESEQGGGIF